MIKKLRIKFITATMLSLFIVLFSILGMMSLLNYQEIITDADKILSVLSDYDGKFPKEFGPYDKLDPPKKFQKEDPLFSPEMPYESRYFFVIVDEEGNAISADTGKIAAIDTSAAIEYAKTAWQTGSHKGFIQDYRYVMNPFGGETQIIFLDCGRSLNTFRSFLFTGIGVCAVGLFSVFLLIVLFSRRIVKPFSENYEKQKRFITDAGHELKTPLTIIDADTEILEMDLGENEWLRDIQNQTKRLAGLTNDLILLSRMEEEENKIQMIEFPISDMIEEVVGTFQGLAKTQKKEIIAEIEPMVSLYGDEKTLRQLTTILLDNAVKYSDEGGQIIASFTKLKNVVKFTVRNTTESISVDHVEHIFDRFYRMDRSRNSQTGGYGLGLSIAAAIVNTHKGKIAAETKDGKYLLITVILPIG